MSRQVLKVSNSLDRKGYQLIVDLYSGKYSGSIVEESHPGLRYATEVVRVLGEQYSYCYIGVPVDTWGAEWAPAVALQQGGPAGRVKLRSRAKVSMLDYNGYSIPLLVGYLTQYAHTLDEDSVVGMVIDDRWLLSKVTAFGAVVYDPYLGTSWHDGPRPLVFNWNGYPDCLDTPAGPRFAPGHLFGWKKQAEIENKNEPAKGKALYKARSWTCADIVEYLRDIYYDGKFPSGGKDYGNTQLSQFIDWPKSFGNQRNFTRVARNFKLENLDLAECLGRTLRKAGPFELQCNPVGWRGQLGIVQVNSRYGGTLLTGPRYGSNSNGGDIADALQDHNRISGGTVVESIVGIFDDVVIAGDAPAVEHEFTHGVGADVVELENAWTSIEEDAFKQIVTDNGSNAAAFLMATLSYPKVYAAYKVSKYWIAYKQTRFADIPPPASPRFLARLLSSYSTGDTNPRNWNPRDIILEVYDENVDPPVWRPCSRYDNLTIIDDGTAFQVTALRDTGDHDTFRSTEYDPTTFVAAKLRITCAVEREFRITGIAKDDPNNISKRVNNGNERFTFLTVAEDGDYVHWERTGAWPTGHSGDPNEALLFPDACETASDKFIFSDLDDTYGGTARLPRHAAHRNKDVKKLDYHGILTMHTWNPHIKPGMQVLVDSGGNAIVPSAVVRSVKFNSQTQAQEVELIAGDNSRIYDMPLSVVDQTAGGSANSTGATTPKTSPTIATASATQDISVVSSANDQARSAGSSTTSETSSSKGNNTETPEQEQKRTERDIVWSIAQSGRNAAWDRKDEAEAQRVKSSIRTGDQMSQGPNESNYSSEAAQRKRDTKEQGMVEKALRKSVQTTKEEQETE